MDNQVEETGVWSRLYLLKTLLSNMPTPRYMPLKDIQLKFLHIFRIKFVIPESPTELSGTPLLTERHTLIEVGTV